MSSRVRVLLLELPPLLRGILEHAVLQNCGRQLLQSASMDLVRSKVPPHPHIIIIGLTRPEDATLVPALLSRWPKAQIATVMRVGAGTVFCQLGRRWTKLEQASPAELVEALHEAVRRNHVPRRARLGSRSWRLRPMRASQRRARFHQGLVGARPLRSSARLKVSPPARNEKRRVVRK